MRLLCKYQAEMKRGDVVFLMRDKCGDDCLHCPSVPRESSKNNGFYKYRMAMMGEIIPGKFMNLSLLPPNLVTGGDFGATSLLYTISDLMDAGLWTAKTERFTFNSDGGPENVSYVQHAVCMTLLKKKVVRKSVVFIRLPSEHHHDFMDTT